MGIFLGLYFMSKSIKGVCNELNVCETSPQNSHVEKS